jgi:P27 family predicted phage terminase small subunit
MAGRRPTPSALKLVKGNPGKRPVNKREPRPAMEPPAKPSHLSPFAGEAWDRVAPELHRLGLLTVVDGVALELLVCAYDDWRTAHDEVTDEGATYETETAQGGRMVRTNPHVAIRADAWRRVKSILAEFGLTPASRAKIETAPADVATDPADAYFG